MHSCIGQAPCLLLQDLFGSAVLMGEVISTDGLFEITICDVMGLAPWDQLLFIA